MEEEADKTFDEEAKMQIENILEPLRMDLEKVVMVIKVELVGRLVRPINVKDLLYEVQDFNENSSELILCRLKDTNGLLLSKKNKENN